MTAFSDRFADIRSRYNELSGAVLTLGEDLEQLVPIQLELPPRDSDALRFYFSVSWMYIAVYETGAVSFRFLADRAIQMRIDPAREMVRFRRDVHAIRTFLQHNLDPEKTEDAEKRTIARRWMLFACNEDETLDAEFWPTTGDQWAKVAERWDFSSLQFLEITLGVVAAIANNPSRDAIVSEWVRRCVLGLRPHEFHPIVIDAASALGLPPITPERVVEKHYSKWNSLLRLLGDGVDVRAEARRIVDQTLTNDWQTYCPVNGDDIIKRFSIPVGPEVGVLLEKARLIWMRERCSPEELLQVLGRDLISAAEGGARDTPPRDRGC